VSKYQRQFNVAGHRPMYISYLAGVQKVQKQDIENWLLRPFSHGSMYYRKVLPGRQGRPFLRADRQPEATVKCALCRTGKECLVDKPCFVQ
jgi:hypothetical protein